MVGRIDNFAVHLDIESLFGFWASVVSAGIKGVFTPDGIPFIFAQWLVIFGVHDGVFALSERYPAKGVAVVDAAVEQDQSHERACQVIGNRDGKIEFDNPLRGLVN